MYMTEDRLKCGRWKTAIELISSIYFSKMDKGSIEYIVRKLRLILKNDELDGILAKIEPLVNGKEDNIGTIADIILNTIPIEKLTLLREKVVKNEQFSDFVQELFFDLESKCENLKGELKKRRLN